MLGLSAAPNESLVASNESTACVIGNRKPDHLAVEKFSDGWVVTLVAVLFLQAMNGPCGPCTVAFLVCSYPLRTSIG